MKSKIFWILLALFVAGGLAVAFTDVEDSLPNWTVGVFRG